MPKVSILIIIFYLAVTTIIFFGQNRRPGNWELFFRDPAAAENLHTQITQDPNTGDLWVTRVFHNKPLTYLNTFFVNTARSVDPVFLFNLTGENSTYTSSEKINLLFPWELPLFILAAVYFVRNRPRVLLYLLPPILLCGLISPAFYLYKFLPLILTIRIIIFVWLKKRF